MTTLLARTVCSDCASSAYSHQLQFLSFSDDAGEVLVRAPAEEHEWRGRLGRFRLGQWLDEREQLIALLEDLLNKTRHAKVRV